MQTNIKDSWLKLAWKGRWIAFIIQVSLKDSSNLKKEKPCLNRIQPFIPPNGAEYAQNVADPRMPAFVNPASCPAGMALCVWNGRLKDGNGKPVTLIKGVLLAETELHALIKDFKRLCGSGGTIKDGVIEIQGDHREKLAEELKKRGFKIKLVGG